MNKFKKKRLPLNPRNKDVDKHTFVENEISLFFVLEPLHALNQFWLNDHLLDESDRSKCGLFQVLASKEQRVELRLRLA